VTAVAPPPKHEQAPAPPPPAIPVAEPDRARPAAARPGPDLSPIVRVAAAAGIAAFAAGHWSVLVVGAPGNRVAGIAMLAALAGALVAATELVPAPRLARLALRLALVAAALAAGLGIAGVEGRMLLPGGWADLSGGLDQGLAALRDADWPYAGLDPWGRLTLLLGLPAFVVTGAALACWPGTRAGALARTLGIGLLVAAYAVATTNHAFDGELARGVVLAALLAAWLAPSRLARYDAAAPAAAALAVAALVALPVAAALDGEDSWLQYKRWNWFGTASGATFEWDHQYGPIDWPRDGRTLLEVRPPRGRALYWRVETLDRFDGFGWVHSSRNSRSAPGGELPRRLDPRWRVEGIGFTVRELRSELVPVTGTPSAVRGAGGVHVARDGTTRRLGRALREGDAYEVDAYVPDPSAARMRAAGTSWPDELRQYLAVELPRPGQTALDGVGRAGDAARSVAGPELAVPFRGDLADPVVDRELAASPYAGTFRLARRLAAGQATTYDVVKRIERHLRATYGYNERVPSHEYPLEAFLFEDRQGYCQQFSGAMALMLRMNGIPARVAAGFAPGSYDRDRGTFRVRDLDAHSWVEAYFPGIGWVSFDPTASGAPAASRARPDRAASSAGTTDGGGREGVAAERSEDGSPAAAVPTAEDGDGGPPAGARLVLVLALALAAAAALVLRARGDRRSYGGRAADRAAAELARALERLGLAAGGSTTLLALERRLGRLAGPPGAAYARRLRDHRYAGGSPEPPGPADRRALRRALASRGGLRWRLRCLRALPPGGPR
jgi:protein-glutamine gamma-glutamyltransferase